jgi:glyoxylase-like metal-dependent hydrolase (beta-lactamase superfamily II)
LGRADWDYALARRQKDGEAADTARILEHLHAAKLLMRVNRDTQIAPGVIALATPGETPGHQIVRIASEGRAFYCLGDLYHHPLEIAHNLTVRWADGARKRASRAGLAIAASHDEPLLMAAHIPGVGALRYGDTSLTWASVTPA